MHLSRFKNFFINRKIKDRLFRAIFSQDKKALLQLYNALHGTDYQNENDLQIVTIENIVYMSMKNDLAFILAGVLNLYEHQSSSNPNMPLRFFLYLGQEYQKIIAKTKENIYGSKLIKLPVPQCVVFYNGNQDEPDEKLLRLSDAFEQTSLAPDAELTVHMLNINLGHNQMLMEKCHKLWEYSYLIHQIRENIKHGLSQQEAVEHAVTHCIENNILADYLLQNKMEVLGMLLTEYNERKVMRFLKKEAHEDGFQEGHTAGLQRGLQNGQKIKLITLTCKKLKKGQSLETIAEDLEENLETISCICEFVKKLAPDYDSDKLQELLKNAHFPF